MVNPSNISLVNDQVQWTITVTNGPSNNVDVFVTLTPDAGWVIDPGSVLNQGTLAANIWTIGAMTPGQVVSAVIMLRKTTNLLGAPWNHIATVTGLDTLGSNNTLTDSVGLVSCPVCPPSGGAIDDPFSCLCGNVSWNDTPCTTGISSWVPVALSEVNCQINYFDQATGRYHIRQIDYTLPWSFKYSLWCDNGSGPVEISGPAVASGPALWLNYDKIPRLSQEDFDPLAAANTVTLSITPLAGFEAFVYRNGSLLPKTAWSIAGPVVTFVNAFGASGGGLYGESVSVHYYKII